MIVNVQRERRDGEREREREIRNDKIVYVIFSFIGSNDFHCWYRKKKDEMSL